MLVWSSGKEHRDCELRYLGSKPTCTILLLLLPLLQGYLEVDISKSFKNADLDSHSSITSTASEGFFTD